MDNKERGKATGSQVNLYALLNDYRQQNYFLRIRLVQLDLISSVLMIACGGSSA